MSSLPLISHHLFVAAVGHELSPDTLEKSLQQASNRPAAIPLEVLEGAEALAELVARPLRTAPAPQMV